MISAILLSLFFILAVVIGIQPVFAADFLGGAVGFDIPTDIATSGTNHIVVNSDGNSVVILDGLLQRVLTFGDVDLNTDGDNNDDGELDAPYGIAVNTENIFVTDTGNNRVQIFDSDGNYVSQFGSVDLDGSKDNGEFDTPRGIAVNDENIFVVDTGYDRIQVFDLDGNYVRQFGSSDFDGPGNNSGEFRQPRGIEVTSDRVYVTDEISDKIVVFDLDGNHLFSFGGSGDANGQFDFPTSVTRERTGLFVVDSHNRRVQVFDVDGNYLDQFSTDFTLNTGRVVQIDPEGHTSFFTNTLGTAVIVTYSSVLANVVLLFGYGEPPIRESAHITGTATISQPDLPTITFNDATVDIALDSEGVGSVAFASLVDGTIVSTENLGSSNVIQFILDPDDPELRPRNPNAAGVVDEMPFQIPSFQTGAHTVVYNKTHFTFNFNDPTFTGTTPNVILQANIQLDADTLPAIHEDKASIAFNIITSVPQLCEAKVGAVSLDFGSLRVGAESSDATIEIKNTGTMNNDVNIGADFWCDATVVGCDYSATSGDNVMVPSRTRFVGDVPPFPGEVPLYAAKTPFTGFGFSDSTTPSIPEQTLFTLPHSTSGTAYLQVNIELIPNSENGSMNRFTGDVTQEILITYGCS